MSVRPDMSAVMIRMDTEHAVCGVSFPKLNDAVGGFDDDTTSGLFLRTQSAPTRSLNVPLSMTAFFAVDVVRKNDGHIGCRCPVIKVLLVVSWEGW